MSIDIYVVSHELEAGKEIRLEDRKLNEFLGDKEESIALHIQDLLKSLTDTIGKSIKHKSNITIEISGSVEFKGQGDLKLLFFNLGGEGTKSNALKVSVETTIEPEPEK